MYPVRHQLPSSVSQRDKSPIYREKKEHQVDRQEESTWKQAYKEAIAEGVKWTLVGLAILAVLAGAGHLIGKAKKKSDKKKKGGSSA